MALRDFTIERTLATGGMCEILLARDGSRRVVVKRLHAHLRSDERMRAMFAHEAKLLGTLRHPCVPSLYEYDGDEANPALAMEYFDGVLLHTWTSTGRAMAPNEAVACVVQLLEGLEHIHRATDAAGAPLEIVHRDVSPANILLATDGTVKLLDFGIATSRELPADAAGSSRGTAGYMAPEVIAGDAVDARADVFCVGVILHELIVGRRLFGGDRLNAMRATMENAIAPPSVAAANAALVPLDAVMLRVLARDPRDRWPDAGAMRRALEAAFVAR